MSDRWLICDVFKGMFSDELAVKYDTSSFFVPRSKVKNEHPEAHRGKVLVKSFSRNSEWFAVLPTEYKTVISVNASDLSPV